MKVMLIRHGQTDWNKKKLVQGWSDIELNEEGINETKKFSKSIEKIIGIMLYPVIYLEPEKQQLLFQSILIFHY